MAKQNLVRAPLGYVFINGQGLVRVTNVDASFSMPVSPQYSGCESAPWHYINQAGELSGSFQSQVAIDPYMDSITVGSTFVAATGVVTTSEESHAIAASVTLSNANLAQDENDKYNVIVVKRTATGDQTFTQVTSSPATGEFQVTNGATPTLAFYASDTGTALITYETVAATGGISKFTSTSAPGNVSLGIPFCGSKLATKDTANSATLWIGRAKITSWSLSAASPGNDLQTITYNWVAYLDEDNVLYKWL